MGSPDAAWGAAAHQGLPSNGQWRRVLPSPSSGPQGARMPAPWGVQPNPGPQRAAPGLRTRGDSQGHFEP